MSIDPFSGYRLHTSLFGGGREDWWFRLLPSVAVRRGELLPAPDTITQIPILMKKLFSLFAVALLALGATHASAETTPTSVIHVVTVSWKADASPEAIQAAIDGVETLAEEFDGITRVWTRSIKVQGGKAAAFVMEFKDEDALKAYAGSDAQKKWYETYIPVRASSATASSRACARPSPSTSSASAGRRRRTGATGWCS